LLKWLQSPTSSDWVSFFNKKKILQPEEYAAKLERSGDVMEEGRVKFVHAPAPNGLIEGEAGVSSHRAQTVQCISSTAACELIVTCEM
jgi:hypothetical protein